MIVAGIDSSLTSTGLAAVDTEARDSEALRWALRRVPTKAVPGLAGLDSHAQRMGTIAQTVEDFLQEQQPDVVAIEGLSMASLGNATRDLAGLWWVIVTRLARAGFHDLVVVAPSTRAKYATGDGRAKKPEVVDGIVAAHGLTLKRFEHDVADAVALAALGARRAGAPVEIVPQPWHEQVVTDFVRREMDRSA